MDTNINKLRNKETEQLQKLKQIVNDSMAAEQLIIDNLLNPPEETLSRGQRISDKVARFGGSWKFIIAFLFIILLWISLNVFAFTQTRFDPYPFILLNLLLSCVAALQAPIIMMSQNRQEEKDRMRSENDYMVNLKAELEIRSLHRKMDLLLEEQIQTLFDTQANQFQALEDIKKMLTEMKKDEKR